MYNASNRKFTFIMIIIKDSLGLCPLKASFTFKTINNKRCMYNVS